MPKNNNKQTNKQKKNVTKTEDLYKILGLLVFSCAGTVISKVCLKEPQNDNDCNLVLTNIRATAESKLLSYKPNEIINRNNRNAILIVGLQSQGLTRRTTHRIKKQNKFHSKYLLKACSTNGCI